MKYLQIVERVAVIIAAVFAVFPMWQFYSERSDRELDRASKFILAQSACLQLSVVERPEEPDQLPPFLWLRYRNNSLLGGLDRSSYVSGQANLSAYQNAVREYVDVQTEYLERLRNYENQLNQKCLYLSKVNELPEF